MLNLAPLEVRMESLGEVAGKPWGIDALLRIATELGRTRAQGDVYGDLRPDNVLRTP
jgi:hypothetical protein